MHSSEAGWPSSCFFFSSRRRHTSCLSDWSSDVCSYDLLLDAANGSQETGPLNDHVAVGQDRRVGLIQIQPVRGLVVREGPIALEREGPILVRVVESGEIGRASCRERGDIAVLVETV